MSDKPSFRTLVSVLLLITAVVAMAFSGPAAAQTGEERSFVVSLNPDGAADIAVTYTFNLTTDSERAAFDELRTNETARQTTQIRFTNRMAAVAQDAENSTGREMSVENPQIDVSKADDGDTGIVVLSLHWNGLAAVDDETLVVTEPFGSGFTPDRTFVIEGPDGYQLDGTTPAADTTQDNRATWDAGTELSGFKATFSAASDNTAASPDATAGDGPGFGSVAALIALLATVAGIARRRR